MVFGSGDLAIKRDNAFATINYKEVIKTITKMDADVNVTSLNTAAMAYLPEGSDGAAVTYSRQLKIMVADMSLYYLSTYYRINERNTIGASSRYFSIGYVNFVDDDFHDLRAYHPNEVASDLNYARSFGPKFSLGGSVHFFYSNL